MNGDLIFFEENSIIILKNSGIRTLLKISYYLLLFERGGKLRIQRKIVAALFVCGIVGLCRAGYTITASTYWVQGVVGDQILYEYTSNQNPVSGGYFAPSGSNRFNSSASFGDLSEEGPPGFSCGSEVYFPDEPEESVNNKYFKSAASSTITFQPQGEMISVYSTGAIWECFSEPEFVGGWVTITDTISGEGLYSFGAYEGIGGGEFPVDPSHSYELYMYFETSGILPVLYNGGYIETAILVTPEPATLSLFVLGGLALIRRKSLI